MQTANCANRGHCHGNLVKTVLNSLPSDINRAKMYSQLSRKRPHLVHEKVVAYERWLRTGTINEMSPKLYPSTNNN